MRLVESTLGRRAALTSVLAAIAAVHPNAPAYAISATTMSGKTKPDLGVVLASETSTVGKQLLADLVLDGGVVATTSFESKWPLAEGNYYDVETSSRDGDVAFVQVKSLDKGKSFGSLPKAWFSDALFSTEGRYGAYGSPTDIKIKETAADGDSRNFEVSFTVLSPGMAEVPRKGVLRALPAPGTSDVLLLTASASAKRWTKSKAAAEASGITSSLRVTSTRPTTLKRDPTGRSCRAVVRRHRRHDHLFRNGTPDARMLDMVAARCCSAPAA